MLIVSARLLDLLKGLASRGRDERGQTATEYVAVTAVAVAIAIGVLWALLGSGLASAIGDLGSTVSTFVSSI